jgi:hypothetical protein
MKNPPHARRGRPPKFGRPSQVVALTLPEEVVRGLRKVHPDLGWAIVTLFEKAPARNAEAMAQPDVELVTIADRRSLIVINREVFKSLPGINIIPLQGTRAFLALDLGRGTTDLELTVIDRLQDPTVDLRERKALRKLRLQLRTWRHDRSLRFHTRSIIVVERLPRRGRKQSLPRRPVTIEPAGTTTESARSASRVDQDEVADAGEPLRTQGAGPDRNASDVGEGRTMMSGDNARRVPPTLG